MTFDEYQQAAQKTDLTPAKSKEVLSISFMDKVLGLVGESGEFADHVKKILRDDNAKLSEEKRQLLIKELGDVLWYIALLSKHLDMPLEEIAKKNIAKLQDRQKRQALRGQGDTR